MNLPALVSHVGLPALATGLTAFILTLSSGCSFDTERFTFNGAGNGGSGAGNVGGSGASGANGGSGADGGTAGAGNDGGGGAAGCEPGEMVSCYSGDPATADVGECVSGMTICTEEGVPGPDCQGEALPGVEDCDNPLDEDCDGFSCSEPLWAKVVGDIDEQTVGEVAVDPNTGEVYVVGSFRGAVDFNGETIVAISRDGYIAKYAPDGTAVWAKALSGTLSEYVNNVAVDSMGNIIVSGTRSAAGSLDFGLGPVGENFIAKFDADGDPLWFEDCVLPSNVINDVKVDLNDDSVVVAATFTGTGSCGGPTFNAAGGSRDMILSKLSSGGTSIWSDQYGGTDSEIISEIDVGSNGHIVMVGQFRGSFAFTNISLTSIGNDNIFIARFDGNGTHIWHKNWGDAANQNVQSVAIKPDGGVVLGGYLNGSITATGGPQLTTGSMYVIALSAGGTHVWSDSWDNITLVPLRDIAISPSGDVYLSGSFNNTLDIGAAAPLSGNFSTGFVARLSGATGSHVWSKVVGGLGTNDYANVIKVATGPLGEIYLAGNAEGSITLVNPALPTMNQDIFVAKIAP